MMKLRASVKTPLARSVACTEPAKERRSLYLGIDPGASGGLAFIAIDATEAVPMPATMKDLWEWFHWWEKGQGCVAAIELVGGHVKGGGGEGGGSSNGSAMFKFGFSAGSLHMALTAASVPFETVHPRTWQKGVGLSPRSKDETRTAFKNRLKGLAQRLFPSVKVTLATADALLIAEYCRRKRTGTLAK